MSKCSNSELISWIIGTMLSVVAVAIELYYLSGLPCGLGFSIAMILATATLTLILAGIKPAFNRYESCWGVSGKECPISFSAIRIMINAVSLVVGGTIVSLFSGMVSAIAECAGIPIVGIGISILTTQIIGAVIGTTLIGTLATFGAMLWAVYSIQACLSNR